MNSDHLPRVPADSPASVILAQYAHVPEAYIALGHLRAEGIPCELLNETNADVLAIPGAQFTLVSLLVRPQDVEHARQILGMDD